MIVPGSANALLLDASAGGYRVSNSLRFRSSASAYLSRTYTTPTDQKKFTMSFWLKLGSFGTSSATILGACTNTSSNDSYIYFSNNKLIIGSYQGAGTDYGISTAAVLRDYSAWYHCVVVFDTANATAADRAIIYINGVRQTVNNQSNGTFPQNHTCLLNSATVHNIARRPTGNDIFYDGYLAETYFIDGQALTPSSFGETNATTGVWQPKAYTGGSYGTNGFYLKFADNSGATATTIGKDSSGNGNNWTPNNISVTAGVTYDSMIDTPTPYDDGGNGVGNYAVINPLKAVSIATATNGNLTANFGVTSTTFQNLFGTIGVSSGKWYFEFVTSSITGVGGGQFSVGVATVSASYNSNNFTSGNGWLYYGTNGNKYNSGGAAYGSTFGVNDVIGVAFDVDNGKIWFAKNNTWQASGNPSAGTNAAFTNLSGNTLVPILGDDQSNDTKVGSINFGQRPFTYTPPSGFKALNTQNLT